MRENSCRTFHYEVTCRKALWLQVREAFWSNFKRTRPANRDFFFCVRNMNCCFARCAEITWRHFQIQSTLPTSSGPKPWREFRLPGTRTSKLKPELSYSEQWSHDGAVASRLAVLTEPSYELVARDVYLSSDCAIFRSVINLRKHPLSVLRDFRTMLKKKNVHCPAYRGVGLRESSVTEKQVKFGRDQICRPP